MALFGIFKKDKGNQAKKGFYEIPVGAIERLTSDTVKVVFDVPADLSNEFQFIPGQYINIAADINGKEERRSYSICSGPTEKLAVAVKAIANGKMSNYLNTELSAGTELHISKPEGSFTLDKDAKTVVAIAAGSGITPILSIAKSMNNTNGTVHLFYGNRTTASTIAANELSALAHVKTTHFLSGESLEGTVHGRITKESFTEQIKANLDLLKADAFFLCGPEQMILDVKEALELFGVAKAKIHFELFTTPVLMKSEEQVVTAAFKGTSKVKAILDHEMIEFNLPTVGKTLLEAVENEGMDAPFSCKGGVCSSCKAKIKKGSASMKINYSLTDKDIEEGYILTCQAHPTSEELIISFDE